MAKITIQDTGKYSVGGIVESGEQIATGDAGVSGDPLTLKNTSIALGQASFTSDPKQSQSYKEDIATNAFDFGEVQKTGVDQPKWNLTCYFSRTDEADMKDMGRLIFMCNTKGYKILTSSTGNGFFDLIGYSKYGENEVNSVSPLVQVSINIRIKNFSVSQSADKKGFRATLNLVETN